MRGFFMSRKFSRRSTPFLIAGIGACLMLGGNGTPLRVDPSVAGTRVSAEKTSNVLILAAGLGNPSSVAMVNQVVPRVSPYSDIIDPSFPFPSLVSVLARTDLLVTTQNNLSGLPPIPRFPEGAVVRVRRPPFPSRFFPPPDTDGDGISDNVLIISENNVNFIIGLDAVVVSPGPNAVPETNLAFDDAAFGGNITVGANGFAESGRCGDDTQNLAVGSFGVPTAVVVGPGANGVLETNPVDAIPVGDDAVGPTGGCALRSICAGLDGTAQSGRGGDDSQIRPCVGHFLETTDVILEGGGIQSLNAGDRILQTPQSGDDVPVIVAALDQSATATNNFDADTTACQNPDGTQVAVCDDEQAPFIPAGTVILNASCTGAFTPFTCCTGAGTGACNTGALLGKTVTVVGPGPNGQLETPPNSAILAGGDLDADTAACRVSGNPANPLIPGCEDVQCVTPSTSTSTGNCFAPGPIVLTATTLIVAPGADKLLQTPARVASLIGNNRDVASFDAQALLAGPNRTAESGGPPVADDVQVVTPAAVPNVNAPPVSAPVGIESVVTMYPAVANMADPIGNPVNSGCVAFLSAGAFSVGSNGNNAPEGDSRIVPVGQAQLGVSALGVICGQEGAQDGSSGLLSGLAGFTYGGFGWTDLSFKNQFDNLLPPSLKDNVYYATRKDGGIVMISYRRARVTDVLSPGILDGPTDLAFVAPSRVLCIGAQLEGGAGVAARCGPQDPPGTPAGRLFVIESATRQVAVVPLEIANVTTDNGLCTSVAAGESGINTESGQGDFCSPKTGNRLDGTPCLLGGVCTTMGVGLPNTRAVADEAGITFMTPPFVTDPVAIAVATTSPVPHTGRVTSGSDGIAQTAACHVGGIPANPLIPGCDDVQVVPVGQGLPNTREIDARFDVMSANYNLSTTPLGDDFVIGGLSPSVPQIPGGVPPTTVTTGPDGIANTPVCNPNPPGSCTDIQSIPVGRGEPFQRIIEAGPNGIVDTSPAGDDRVLNSPTLLVANRHGTVVWMDLQGFDPIAHTGSPRFFVTPLSNITGMAVGDYVNGEGLQVLLTTTDFGGAVVSFDLTLADNALSVAATLEILTDINDTISQKLDTSMLPIPPPASPRPTGLSHIALDYYPGPDGYIGTADDPHFNEPNNLGDLSNISFVQTSEPNEMTLNGGGGNIYSQVTRLENVRAGSYSVNTLNSPADGILDGDPTTDLYNFISGKIAINVGRFPKRSNAILAGPDRVVQTTACMTPGGAPIPGCDDVQLTQAGDNVFSGPRGMRILAGPNGIAESGRGGDDVQLQPVGKTFGTPGFTVLGSPYFIWTTNEAVLGPGPNGVLNTCPGGDDTVGVGSTGIMALCPGVVASLVNCPADFRALGIGCTVPTASCPANTICTGPNGVAGSGLAAGDVQLVPPGTAGLSATTPVVGPGSNEFIETPPGGDDRLGGGQPLDVVIEPGPDEILQTPPAPGDIAGPLTPLSVVDLDIFAFSRPVSAFEFRTMPYAFLDPAGANSGVVDISGGRTSNALDAGVDGIFPGSLFVFGPNYESPTGETDFIVRNISLTAAIDNKTGLVFGRGVERNAQLPALALIYLDVSLDLVNNAFVGSSIVGRQIVRAPAATFQQDRMLRAAAKKKK